MRIEQIQAAFIKAGFQWKEQIFNDGWDQNCMVEFTRDKSPHALSTYPRPADGVGWGRFERSHAWEQAYEWLLKEAVVPIGV
jgi:hypothetical protein